MLAIFLNLLLTLSPLSPAGVTVAANSMPTCPSGDSVVLVNPKTKTYSAAPAGSMSSGSMSSSMATPKPGMTYGCMSKVKAMGMKPASKSISNGMSGTGGPYTSGSPAPMGGAGAAPPNGPPSHTP